MEPVSQVPIMVKSNKEFWTKDKDQHLRDWYNDSVKVDPAQLALRLGTGLRIVINRLSILKLRHRLKED